MRIFITFILLIISRLSFSQYTEIINSNNPGESMGAYSVGRKVAQLEMDFFYEQSEHKLLKYKQLNFGTSYQIRYGVGWERLELILNGTFLHNFYTNTQRGFYDIKTGFYKNTLGAKFLIYNPKYYEKINLYSWRANHKFSWKRLIPAVSVYVGANFFPKNYFLHELYSTDTKKITPKALISLQSHPTQSTVLIANFTGDNFISKERELGYIFTIVQNLNESRWSIFAENQGVKSPYYSDLLFRLGGSFLITKNLQANAWAGTSWKNTPLRQSVSVGFSYRFYDNHKRLEFIEKLRAREKENASQKFR